MSPSRIFAPLLFAMVLPCNVDALELHSGSRQNTLIELYTSQGCSSCPPAERWLGSLQHDPRLWRTLIPVAFHVDYWDHLGWRDALARPAFSARQRRYQREGGLSAVYTPGFVVNGREWRRWFGLRELPPGDQSAGELILRWQGRELTVHYSPAAPTNGPLVLNVALLGVGLRETVARGENAGKTLPQDFVVLQLQQWQSHHGRWSESLERPQPPPGVRLAIAAWVNRAGRLQPLQALGGWLPAP